MRKVDVAESVCQNTLNSIENPSCHATFNVGIFVAGAFGLGEVSRIFRIRR